MAEKLTKIIKTVKWGKSHQKIFKINIIVTIKRESRILESLIILLIQHFVCIFYERIILFCELRVVEKLFKFVHHLSRMTNPISTIP